MARMLIKRVVIWVRSLGTILTFAAAICTFNSPAWADRARPKLVVAWASVHSLKQVDSLLRAFRSGLAAHGFYEGQNLVVVTRSADGARDRMPAILDELVAVRPAVIVTHGAATFSARRVTTVPVVFGFSGDPVVAGLTDSLSRPSKNLTGITMMSVELNEKRLDLLHQLAPLAKTVVLMGDPIHPGANLEVEATEKMAKQLGIEIRWMPTTTVKASLDLLASMESQPPDALVVLPDAIMLASYQQITDFARRHRIPAISGWSTFAEGGGLFTYGPRLTETFRHLAYYVAKIAAGSKPSDLPIERPTIFELVINLKTARDIGLTIPPAVLARADEIIE